MVRIGFVIDTISCDTAGTQKQLIETLKRLDRKKFEPHLICLWRSPWMEHNSLPCPVHIVGHRGFFKLDSAKALGRFAAFLESIRFDIIQTFFVESIFAACFGAMLSRDKPVLLSSRRDIGLGAGVPWYHFFYRIALPLANLKFDGIVANSLEVKRFVMKNEVVRAGKIRVIRNGIDTVDDSVNPESGLRNTDGMLNIGLVGNLSPVKRVDVFLNALFLVKHSMPELRFRALIYGDGPERENLISLTESLGLASVVHFQGQVKDIDAQLRSLDIGVLCSDREGLSNAILEYMAHGLPIVATAVGGNPELVDGRNGFCVEPGRPEALADALIRLCRNRDLRLKLGRASFEKLKAAYSWEKSMRDLEDYYIEMVERKSCIMARMNPGIRK
jgi:glycosyltransferase involved in cell wall biosynthesis